MRNILLMYFTLCCGTIISCTNHCAAHNTLGLGVGVGSATQLLDGTTTNSRNYSPRFITHYYGTWALTYRYAVSKGAQAGLAVAFEHEAGNMRIAATGNNAGNTVQLTGTFERNVLTIAPEIMCYYFQYNTVQRDDDVVRVRGYGYLGIGFTFVSEEQHYFPAYYNATILNGQNAPGSSPDVLRQRTYFNGQFCPIGVIFGKRIGGFFELGFGYKGILSGGCFVRW